MWTKRVKNAVILWDLNIGENWLMNRIMTLKLQYIGHVKFHSGLERTVKRAWFLEGGTGGDQCRGGYRTLKTPWAWVKGTGNQSSLLGRPIREQCSVKDLYEDFTFRLNTQQWLQELPPSRDHHGRQRCN
ncbi:hypothetical protein BsWGS_00288 [Bradybaena similaris]